jgi:hypothetical protein
MKYNCPVCAFNGLDEPPEDFTICPSCGTEFDYHDLIRGHDELRSAWIATGPKWHSTLIPAPPEWNGLAQLKSAGLIEYEPFGADTPTQIVIVEVSKGVSMVPVTWGTMRLETVQYALGTIIDRLVNTRFVGAST